MKQLKKGLVQGYVYCTLIDWRLAEKERKTLSGRVSLHGLEAIEGKGSIRPKRSVKHSMTKETRTLVWMGNRQLCSQGSWLFSSQESCICVCKGDGVHVEVRGQLGAVGSLLPPREFWGSNSGHQPWRQVSLPANLSHGPGSPL